MYYTVLELDWHTARGCTVTHVVCHIYIDIVGSLKQANTGYSANGCYMGCIMYADNLLLTFGK